MWGWSEGGMTVIWRLNEGNMRVMWGWSEGGMRVMWGWYGGGVRVMWRWGWWWYGGGGGWYESDVRVMCGWLLRWCEDDMKVMWGWCECDMRVVWGLREGNIKVIWGWIVTSSLTMNETSKWLPLLPVLKQALFKWWRCSVIIQSPSPTSWDLGPHHYLFGDNKVNQTKSVLQLTPCIPFRQYKVDKLHQRCKSHLQ